MGFIKDFAVGFASILGLIIAYLILNTITSWIQSATGLDPFISFILIVAGMILIGFIYGWFYLYPKVKALMPSKETQKTEEAPEFEYKIKEE